MLILYFGSFLASSRLSTVAVFSRKTRATIPGMLFHSSRSVCARAAIMGLNLCWEANCSGELFTLQSPTRGRKRERERSKPLKFSSLLMRVASRTRCCISIGFSFRQSGSQLAYLAVGNICCCFPLTRVQGEERAFVRMNSDRSVHVKPCSGMSRADINVWNETALSSFPPTPTPS